MRCYVAGPMRSKPAYNFPAFFAAEAALRARGWTVFNPARMDEEMENIPTTLTVEEQVAQTSTPEAGRRYAERDLDVIVNMLRAEDGDILVVLPEWETSTGARAEVAVAAWVGLPVVPLDEAVRA